MAQKNAQPSITTAEHIPASEQHAKGFPPFDASTFASQLLWLAITFVALYLLMSRIALPRIGSILETRHQRVEGDLAEAQRLKDQSDAAIAAHEKALAEARGRAQHARLDRVVLVPLGPRTELVDQLSELIQVRSDEVFDGLVEASFGNEISALAEMKGAERRQLGQRFLAFPFCGGLGDGEKLIGRFAHC